MTEFDYAHIIDLLGDDATFTAHASEIAEFISQTPELTAEQASTLLAQLGKSPLWHGIALERLLQRNDLEADAITAIAPEIIAQRQRRPQLFRALLETPSPLSARVQAKIISTCGLRDIMRPLSRRTDLTDTAIERMVRKTGEFGRRRALTHGTHPDLLERLLPAAIANKEWTAVIGFLDLGAWRAHDEEPTPTHLRLESAAIEAAFAIDEHIIAREIRFTGAGPSTAAARIYLKWASSAGHDLFFRRLDALERSRRVPYTLELLSDAAAAQVLPPAWVTEHADDVDPEVRRQALAHQNYRPDAAIDQTEGALDSLLLD